MMLNMFAGAYLLATFFSAEWSAKSSDNFKKLGCLLSNYYMESSLYILESRTFYQIWALEIFSPILYLVF